MAPSKKGQAAQAEVVLLQSLKNCLVNLPTSLVSLLDNANTVAQNVIVEVNFRQSQPGKDKPVDRSVFFGWTGMASKRKPTGVVGREGLSAKNREQEAIEIDATFGRLLGMLDGQKVAVHLHLDPPQAHTIAIEPLTPSDWEIIELHAQFLELNFLSQIRALPNPTYTTEGQKQPAHPLTLHLSPTSTANVVVTSLTPTPASSSAFVKISPDAEVHVAPKTRQQSERTSESRSVTSAGRRSAGGHSGTSTVRRRSGRRDGPEPEPVFLRGIDISLGGEWFEDDETMQDSGLKVWVDRDHLLSRPLRGITWVSVSVVKPAGLIEPVDPQKDAADTKYAHRVVARLEAWEDAPDSQHVALSSMLSACLAATGMVGGLVRIEPAPPQISKYQSSDKDKGATVKTLKLEPFLGGDAQSKGGLRFGGESKQEKEDAAQVIRSMYGKGAGASNVLAGPLTDGMILPPPKDALLGWQGAILRFDPAPQQSQDGPKSSPVWFVAGERKFNISLREETTKPSAMTKGWSPAQPLPAESPSMVGIDSLIADMTSQLAHQSSVLLTGGLGAGKTSLAYLLAHRLRNESLFHTAYFSCRQLVGDETRVSTVKETLNRLFGSAAWGARLGGRSVVILDDLDQLCPVETELQVGGENGRSRQVSEVVCSTIRQYCTMGSGVVLLATAQSKESVNNVVIGGHVVREIVSLKAPNKEGRRRVLEALVHDDTFSKSSPIRKQEAPKDTKEPGTVGSWHDHSSSDSRPSTSSSGAARSLPAMEEDDEAGFVVDKNIDLLDLAGQTDGYMPGDLVLLVSRARSEALMRSISDSSSGPISLGRGDFAAALKGFTPASLRNVTLQSSTTKWSSIGGLHSTRQTLLETLQYPTTYAPIFAQCPLRLRSGLLLYGYPGCGKTLLASAVAGECGLNFISVKGPEILNKYIGASEKSVRDLFERAEAARPCVLFFDEFDSIAPKRGHDSTGVTDRVVNQLLTQMDGAEGLSGVYVLAATSRPDLIDPALLRPGRLDKSLICNMPDLAERMDILRAVSAHLRFEPSLLGTDAAGENLREIAARTDGYSGADLQAVVYNAQLEAIHDALGDADPSLGATKSSSHSAASLRPGKTPDFLHFRYGDDADAAAAAREENTPAAVAERAAIAAKIAQLQQARRREREARHASYGAKAAGTDADAEAKRKEGANSEPVIEWKHVLTSLAGTRASISPQERRRLEGIYSEFVSGRNGELPNGQGSTEIGGRTSLM